jgi:8-oxo-dGTP pyrophosphatase MutT (NUDIX family)
MQVGCAVIYHNNKLLLLKKTKGTFKDKYEFPGGKKENLDISIKYCVKRELLEEIGCESYVENLIHFEKIPKEHFNTEQDILLYFYKVKLKNYNITLSDEHSDFKWVTFDEARNLNMIDIDYKLLQKFENYFIN